MSDERTTGVVRVGDRFERAVEPGVLWEVTQIAPGLVRAEEGTAVLRVARLESGPEWAFETIDRLTAGEAWRRAPVSSASEPGACSGRGSASCL
jgi:hypothetical protein